MPAASRIRLGHMQPFDGWVVLDPDGRALPSTFATARRKAIASWQAIWPALEWRTAYGKGWRVVRVTLRLHRKSHRQITLPGDRSSALDVRASARQIVPNDRHDPHAPRRAPRSDA